MVEIYQPNEGIQSINGLTGDIILAAGTNISLVPIGNTITINSTGVGQQRETPTGTIDGANVTFTVTHIPDHINQDGATYFEGYGYTRVGLILTMIVPPTGFIISFY